MLQQRQWQGRFLAPRAESAPFLAMRLHSCVIAVQWRNGVSCAASLPKLQPSALDQPEPYGQHHKVDEKVRGGLQLAKEEQMLAERN